MKILLVIDVQEGYINNHTRHTPNDIEKHIKNFDYDLVVSTRFITSNDSLFKSELNINHMSMLSSQAKLVPTIAELSDIILMKSTYTSLTPDLVKLLEKNNVDELYIAGLNTETAILTTALDLFDRGIKPKILSNLCMSTHGNDTNKNVLSILENAIGADNIL